MSLIRKCINVDGPKKNIVVFDGGGVRGRFGLEFCCLLAEGQDVPLSQLFSMIVGVSAGAMIGTIVALGLLDNMKTAAATCASFYTFMPQMFSKRNALGPTLAPKYDGSGKLNALRKILGSRTFADIKTPLVICCCTPGGAPYEFCSWDEKFKHVLLADALDASSAAPIYFPPVKIANQWLIDGGVIANKPLETALLAAMSQFDQVHIRLLSIGTTEKSTRALDFMSQKGKASTMGALAWIGVGLLNIMLGVEDDTTERLMKAMFAERFMRIECEATNITIDDYSKASSVKFDEAARKVWHENKEYILEFIKPN